MPPRIGFTSVPKVNQVVPGAAVHIVLKQDQPTGRTVQGTIQTVLTRGNHPRGIKVRLSDGRVGRVQSMASGGSSAPANGTSGNSASRPQSADGMEGDAPRQQIGLDAFIRGTQKQRRHGNRVLGQPGEPGEPGQPGQPAGTARRNSDSLDSPTIKCPVCGDFKGDEAAVSHHVSTHFE